MRKFVLAVAATATLGAFSFSVTADAMPVAGKVAPAAQAPAHVEKTVVVVTKKVVRPVRRKVCTTTKGPRGMVRRCVTR